MSNSFLRARIAKLRALLGLLRAETGRYPSTGLAGALAEASIDCAGMTVGDLIELLKKELAALDQEEDEEEEEKQGQARGAERLEAEAKSRKIRDLIGKSTPPKKPSGPGF